MSAEERLLVLEQLVASMKGEVIAALIAAARVEQRATNAETRVFGVRGEGVVDTRLLGATGPRTVGDSSSSWATLAQWTQNLNSESKVLPEASITNSALHARDERVSTQLCYM